MVRRQADNRDGHPRPAEQPTRLKPPFARDEMVVGVYDDGMKQPDIVDACRKRRDITDIAAHSVRGFDRPNWACVDAGSVVRHGHSEILRHHAVGGVLETT